MYFFIFWSEFHRDLSQILIPGVDSTFLALGYVLTFLLRYSYKYSQKMFTINNQHLQQSTYPI